MCIIITIVGFIMAFNFFQVQNYMATAASVGIALFFLVLMLRNINHVKKLKKEKEKEENLK